MKHILFLTDFSENAKNAIYYGLSLFGKEPCKFTCLNTIPIIYDSSGFPIALQDIISENTTKSFKLLKEQINKDFKKNTFNIETIFRVGELVSIASSMVAQKKIDLIIMGTKGESELPESLMGSHTTSIIKHLKCPVLAIPKKVKFKAPKKIALAVDRELVTSKRVLTPVLELAHKYKSEILVVHVVIKGMEEKLLNKNKTDLLLKTANHTYHITHNKEVIHGIDAFVKEKKIDILVMINHKLKFFESIFHQSTTKRVSFYTKVPLLVMHDKK